LLAPAGSKEKKKDPGNSKEKSASAGRKGPLKINSL